MKLLKTLPAPSKIHGQGMVPAQMYKQKEFLDFNNSDACWVGYGFWHVTTRQDTYITQAHLPESQHPVECTLSAKLHVMLSPPSSLTLKVSKRNNTGKSQPISETDWGDSMCGRLAFRYHVVQETQVLASTFSAATDGLTSVLTGFKKGKLNEGEEQTIAEHKSH